jgi:hypothetical protein
MNALQVRLIISSQFISERRSPASDWESVAGNIPEDRQNARNPDVGVSARFEEIRLSIEEISFPRTTH